MNEKQVKHGDYTFRLTRRRYGRQFYCWAELCVEGGFTSLGDPWPCATPKRAELTAAADAWHAWHKTHAVTFCN